MSTQDRMDEEELNELAIMYGPETSRALATEARRARAEVTALRAEQEALHDGLRKITPPGRFPFDGWDAELRARLAVAEQAKEELVQALRKEGVAAVLEAVSYLLASEPGRITFDNGLDFCACSQFRSEKSCIHSSVARAAKSARAALTKWGKP